MRESEGKLPAVIAYMRNTFAMEVVYYGKRMNRQQVIEEQRKYLMRWPERKYDLKPETIRVECDDKQPICHMPASSITAPRIPLIAGCPRDRLIRAARAVLAHRGQDHRGEWPVARAGRSLIRYTITRSARAKMQS
jgi:hypothetical protein